MSHGTSNHPLGLDTVPGHTAFSSGVAGHVYNEAGFRHFLHIELRRAVRSGHCVLLVLVVGRAASGRRLKLTPLVASRIFAALGATVREVDFVGWFKDGSVAAAVLVQRATPPAEIRQQIARRVSRTMNRERIPGIRTTRIRVVPLRGKH